MPFEAGGDVVGPSAAKDRSARRRRTSGTERGGRGGRPIRDGLRGGGVRQTLTAEWDPAGGSTACAPGGREVGAALAGRPFFSVVVPTHRRVGPLRRAIDSALAQTYADFEIVVSDDEDPPGAAWSMLASSPRPDARIRPVRNLAPHGQVPNTNNGIREARGRWVKLLHDDDVLHPDCLERFHEAIGLLPEGHGVRLASCRHDAVGLDGRVDRWRPDRSTPPLEWLSRRDAALAMFLFEDTGSSLPSCLCLDRDWLVANDLWMEEDANFVSSVDSLWSLRLASAGDKLIINRALVSKTEQGQSITAATNDALLDAELDRLKELQWLAIPEERRPVSVRAMQRAVRIRRAVHRLVKRRRIGEALTLLGDTWDVRAWTLAGRNVFARRWPRYFRQTKLTAIAPVDGSVR